MSRSRLWNLREIADAVNATADLGAVFEQIVLAVSRHTSWSSAGLMAVNKASGYSELVSRYDEDERIARMLPRRWPLATSPTRLVAASRKPLVLTNVQGAHEFPGYQEDCTKSGYQTVTLLPLNVTDPLGSDLVLAAHSRQHKSVDDNELEFLQTVTHLASIAVDKAKSIEAIRSLNARLQRERDLNAVHLGRLVSDGDLEAVARIKAYDADTGGALLATTTTFIDLGCRYQATAEQLGIHISTLRYRLARIRDMFGINLMDPETRFAISLAIRLEGAGRTGD
ncbi:MAG: helix-turn-helix domain-containing protein [Pseudorhodoplanes sp.]